MPGHHARLHTRDFCRCRELHELAGVKAREVVPVRLPDASGREASLGAGAVSSLHNTGKLRDIGREGQVCANPEDSLCIQPESSALRALPGRLPARGLAMLRPCLKVVDRPTPTAKERREAKRRGFSKRLGSCGENHAAWCVNRARQGRTARAI